MGAECACSLELFYSFRDGGCGDTFFPFFATQDVCRGEALKALLGESDHIVHALLVALADLSELFSNQAAVFAGADPDAAMKIGVPARDFIMVAA